MYGFKSFINRRRIPTLKFTKGNCLQIPKIKSKYKPQMNSDIKPYTPNSPFLLLKIQNAIHHQEHKWKLLQIIKEVQILDRKETNE